MGLGLVAPEISGEGEGGGGWSAAVGRRKKGGKCEGGERTGEFGGGVLRWFWAAYRRRLRMELGLGGGNVFVDLWCGGVVSVLVVQRREKGEAGETIWVCGGGRR